MDWVLLSERMLERERSHISWGINYEFEDVFVKMTGAQVVAPQNGSLYLAARRLSPIGRYAAAAVDRTCGRYAPIPPFTNGHRPRALMVVGMGAASLRILRSIRNIRKEFDLIVAYILDSFEPFPADVVDKIDHIFNIIPELNLKTPSEKSPQIHDTPLACDVLGKGSAVTNRGIDVLAYGRQPDRYSDVLDEHFLEDSCEKVYLTRFSHSRASDWRYQRKQFWSVLSQSRISIAFVPEFDDDPRFKGLPVISARWYEGLAAGCFMVGKPPETSTFKRLFNWTDAVVRLDTPKDAPGLIEGLLADSDRLRRAHVRNHYMMLSKLDARLMIAGMFAAIGMSVPTQGQEELVRLNYRIAAVERICASEGIGFSQITESQMMNIP